MKQRLGGAFLVGWMIACGSQSKGSPDQNVGGGAADGGAQEVAGGAGAVTSAGANAAAGYKPVAEDAGSGGLSGSTSGAAGESGAGQAGELGAETGGLSGSAAGGAGGTSGSAGTSGGGASSSGGTAGASGGTAGASGGTAGASGGAGSGGGASVETAFRMDALYLREPHVFVNVFGCNDVTDTSLLGFSVNALEASAVVSDSNNDGFLDYSPVLLFRPLNQTSGSSTNSDFLFGDCTSPLASTACSPDLGRARTSSVATSQSSGTCLSPIVGTTHPYSPAVTSSTGPCFVANLGTVTVSLGGAPVPLQDARISATYSGTPATRLSNGLFMGFLTESDAASTLVPTTIPLVGGKPLSSILPGGANSCPTYSDRDLDNGVSGWWFYFNFTAKQVTWSEQP